MCGEDGDDAAEGAGTMMEVADWERSFGPGQCAAGDVRVGCVPRGYKAIC